MDKRISWDEYFIEMARTVSKRSTCTRLSVGSVIVKGNRVISTGYNGSPAGVEHCEDVGCYMKNGSCQRTIHAELNAIMGVEGKITEDVVLYVTHYPCYNCAKHIVQSGIKKVVYTEDYRNGEDTVELFKSSGVTVLKG